MAGMESECNHEISNKQILLVEYADDQVTEKHFKVDEILIDSRVKPGSGDVLVQNLWFSVDPYSRLRMYEVTQGLYSAPYELGKPISILAVSRVISSDIPKYKPGDYVTGLCLSNKYTVLPGGKDFFGNDLQIISYSDATPLQHYLGMLGFPGFTAWIGLVRICQAKPGDEVFVTSAAGGVGLAVGQLAKMKGCRVVGSVSSDVKVKLLKEQYAYDDAFNYKTETDWDAALARNFPNGIDIYFDNVGGQMLETVVNHIKYHARIAVCGMISQYNKDWREGHGIRNLMNIVGKCAKLEGFLALDHSQYYPEFIAEMSSALKQDKVVSSQQISEGIESFPSAFVGMMSGKNIGKALVRI